MKKAIEIEKDINKIVRDKYSAGGGISVGGNVYEGLVITYDRLAQIEKEITYYVLQKRFENNDTE